MSALIASAFAVASISFLLSGSAEGLNGTNPAITAQTSTVPQSTTSDGQTDCGGVTMLKSDGTPWVCTFDDEFDGTTLNASNWNVVQTATSGYHSGSECYMDSPNNVNVSGGTLNLTLVKTAPFLCKSLTGGNYMTDYTAGAVDSLGDFSQTYGYFEVKAKFPAATIKGLQTSLWLWPVNASKYGSTWPASGEIDIAEWYSEYPSLAIPYIHYNPAGGASRDPNVTNDYCSVTNTNGYNTYAVEWTSQSISMIIDGQTCVTDVWNPAAPEVKPDPFNMPFFLNLTSAMGIVTNAPAYNIGNDLPATSNIDYVRVWS
jgi:beta-glucanase (GH16 family)